ncbi:MAG: hypothetical protein A2Z24_00205 [Candidatus Woykebacteria bacterium RBG_16_44_10]|uniref:VWFA domain-containing protein n=1 Tax=Candidatus Woykebacteria bacterium RBG_16_44_10 TaxID=1802597 RepID=A0A1G1WG00_9BACT|nr:MAG: hypothetical protein A2Z24_00205 [Candidatus Woykebacteria bacterium RBG_16_44_10]
MTKLKLILRPFIWRLPIFVIVLFVTVFVLSIKNNQQTSAQVSGCSPIPTKNAIPMNNVKPGDTVDITIGIPGCTANLRNEADTVLVMDRTESMNSRWGSDNQKKIRSAKNALKSFVDQTQEVSSNQPGDHVGLVTYARTASTCNPIDPNCATRDFALANMTAANKTSLNAVIDSMCGGATDSCSISVSGNHTAVGAGLSDGTAEILNNSRLGVPRYIVLATDGRQNIAPSPYELGILQAVLDNNIVVMTVGIGSDVTDSISLPSSSCVNCPDLNGDGRSSGDEILKDIACRTDQHRLDPADNCLLTYNTSNSPSVNDLDNPAHYFYANDSASLDQIYQAIAGEISSNVWYQVLDALNSNVFQNIVPGSLNVVNCSTGSPWPGFQVLYVQGTAFLVRLQDVGANDTVCINLKAVVRDDVVTGDYNVDQIGLAVIWDPNNLCDPAVDGIMKCVLQMKPLPRIDIPNGFINIVNPDPPWLKTEIGDVGVVVGLIFPTPHLTITLIIL